VISVICYSAQPFFATVLGHFMILASILLNGYNAQSFLNVYSAQSFLLQCSAILLQPQLFYDFACHSFESLSRAHGSRRWLAARSRGVGWARGSVTQARGHVGACEGWLGRAGVAAWTSGRMGIGWLGRSVRWLGLGDGSIYIYDKADEIDTLKIYIDRNFSCTGKNKPLSDLLHEYNLPPGLFPRNIICYEYDESRSKLVVHLAKPCEVSFKDSSSIRYAPRVKATLSRGKLSGVEGMKTKVVVWVKVTSVSVESYKSDKVCFIAGVKKLRQKDVYEVPREAVSVEEF
jgi:hypothetical protein